MDNTERDRVLSNFVGSKLLGIRAIYGSGLSDSLVLAAEFQATAEGGLEGPYVVKIDSSGWAFKEEELYTKILLNSSLRPFVADFRQRTKVRKGSKYGGVAYDVAFESDPAGTSTLATLIDQGNVIAAARHIKRLGHALVDWNIETAYYDRTVIHPYELFREMLGAERVRDLSSRLRQLLPGWRQDVVQVRIEGQKRLLPNPVMFVDEAFWNRHLEQYNRYASPRGQIHGDLHTGNVLCLPKRSPQPKVIDLARYRNAANPFYDIAYLEFDILQHALPVKDDSARAEWLSLMEFVSSAVVPKGRPKGGNFAQAAWDLIRPLRLEAERLRLGGGGKHRLDFEISWWLATAAVGLTFSRMLKLICKPEPLARTSALLYAAYGLDRATRLLRMSDPLDVYAIQWLSEDAEVILSLSGEPMPITIDSHDSGRSTAAITAFKTMGQHMLRAIVRSVNSARSLILLANDLLLRDPTEQAMVSRAIVYLKHAAQNIVEACRTLVAARDVDRELHLGLDVLLSRCYDAMLEGVHALMGLVDVAKRSGSCDATGIIELVNQAKMYLSHI